MDTPQEKICTKCHISKPLSEFVKVTRRTTGVAALCKACMNAYNVARVDMPKIFVEKKLCKKCNTVKPIEEFGKSRHARDMHTTHCLACKRIANDVNEEARRAAYFANQEDKKEYAKVYYLDNRPKRDKQSAAWGKAHPESGRARAKRRRALKANCTINDFADEQWLEIQEIQKHRCYYCGKRCKGKMTQDHLTALSQGGDNTLHNIIGVCHSCNAKKHIGPPLTPVQPLLLTIAPSRKPRQEGLDAPPKRRAKQPK